MDLAPARINGRRRKHVRHPVLDPIAFGYSASRSTAGRTSAR
jgi:hypothetical protein